MSMKRKVIPVHDGAIGMMHPIDGVLAADGSEWTLDDFTQRRLHDQSIAHFEQPAISKQTPRIETQEPTIIKPVAKVTATTPKIER